MRAALRQPPQAAPSKPRSPLQTTPQKIFRRCACETCETCNEDHGPIARKATSGGVPGPPPLPVSQPGDASEIQADRMADEALRATPALGPFAPTPAGSGGRALPASTRSFFEQRFGHDFGAVRVHTDASAAAAARGLNAEAFTIGGDIHFGEGQFAPATDRGRRLIAHELAHVVQQAFTPALQRQVHLSSCPHDQPQGSGCGVFSWKGAKNELSDFVEIGTDRIITAVLGGYFPGTWVGQLLSPPNPVKKGERRGYVDAAKVTAASSLRVEVLEIKSRDTASYSGTTPVGGCSRAMDEANGYVSALQPLAPHIVSISTGLARSGGLVVPPGKCRAPGKDAKQALTALGVDFTDPESDSLRAWCTYNDLQNKVGTPFKAGFTSVTFAPNTDGSPGKDYLVAAIPIECKRGSKTVAGTKQLIFEVNGKGGLSYRCDKRCGDKPDDKDQPTDQPMVPADKGVKRTIQETDEDFDPNEHGVRLPPSGVDATDVAIYTAIGVSTIAAIHRLLKNKATSAAEERLLRDAGEKVIEQMEDEGAIDAARALDGVNASKWGTEAGDELVASAEKVAAEKLTETTEKEVAERLALTMEETAAKSAAKGIFEAAGKALPVIAIALVAKDAVAATIQMSRGAKLHVGFSASDTHLGSGTHVSAKGDQPSGKDVVDNAELDQTQVDIDIPKAPDVKGLVDLKTDKVTIKGKLDVANGDPVTVNMNVHIGDTTLIYTSTGTFEGGNIVIDQKLDITDSTIEIDLPPGTKLGSTVSDKPIELKGVHVKVTQVGSGTGTPSSQPAQGKGAAGGSATQPATDKPAEPPLSDAQKKLIGAIQADPNVKKVYDAVVGKKGIRLSEEALQRLLAIKAALAQKPELADRLISLLQDADIKDPIKDLIEPMEAEIRKAAEEDAQKSTPAPQTGGVPTGSDHPTTDTDSTAPPAPDPCDAADKLALSPMLDAHFQSSNIAVKFGQQKLGQDKPPDSVTVPITLLRKDTPGGPRTYKFGMSGDSPQQASSFDHHIFYWAADYTFTIPGGPIQSEQNDYPICFSDAGSTQVALWGRVKKK